MKPYSLTYLKATSIKPPVYVQAAVTVTGETAIPAPTGPLQANETTSFILTLQPDGNQLNPVLRSPQGANTNFRMQVWAPPTTFVISLDPAWSWFFDDPAVTLKTVNPPPAKPPTERYSNLRTLKYDAAGNPVSVSFDAIASGLPLGSVDFCFLNVVFNPSQPDGSTARIFLKIDPVIPNPGDDPGHP